MLRDDRNNTNLDRRWFTNPGTEPLGYARVGKMNGTNFEEKASLGDCSGNGSYVSDIDIDAFSSANGGNLAIRFSRSNVNLGNAYVYWRYTFGGDNGQPQYNTQDHNKGIEGKGELILKFKDPDQCVVLHIWLYKVKDKTKS